MATYRLIRMTTENTEDAASVPTTADETDREETDDEIEAFLQEDVTDVFVFDEGACVATSRSPSTRSLGEFLTKLRKTRKKPLVVGHAPADDLGDDDRADEDAVDDFVDLASQMVSWGIEAETVAASLREAADVVDGGEGQ